MRATVSRRKPAYPVVKVSKSTLQQKQFRLDIVRLLLTKGAELDAKANDGGTPLMAAAFGGHTRVVELLAAEGAEVNAEANNGATALINVYIAVQVSFRVQ